MVGVLGNDRRLHSGAQANRLGLNTRPGQHLMIDQAEEEEILGSLQSWLGPAVGRLTVPAVLSPVSQLKGALTMICDRVLWTLSPIVQICRIFSRWLSAKISGKDKIRTEVVALVQ
jgi:hypothetical protein